MIPILGLLIAVIFGSMMIETFNPDYRVTEQLTCEFPLSEDMNIDNLHKDEKFGKYMGWSQFWRGNSEYKVVEDNELKLALNQTYLPKRPLLRDDTWGPRKC